MRCRSLWGSMKSDPFLSRYCALSFAALFAMRWIRTRFLLRFHEFGLCDQQNHVPPPDGRWRRGIPSRGKYLTRQNGTGQMRPVAAVLKLRPPYLAVVSSEPA